MKYTGKNEILELQQGNPKRKDFSDRKKGWIWRTELEQV